MDVRRLAGSLPLFTVSRQRLILGVVVAVWWFDVQYHSAVAEGTDHYYWTNAYSWVQDDGIPAPDPDILDALQLASCNVVSWFTARVNYRVRRADGGYDVIVQDERSGTMHDVGENPIYGNCVLAWGLDADGRRVGYKRLLGPWGQSWMFYQVWWHELTDQLQAIYDEQFAPLPLCNRRGVRIASWRVAPMVYMWQQRHGTKRRARPVIALG